MPLTKKRYRFKSREEAEAAEYKQARLSDIYQRGIHLLGGLICDDQRVARFATARLADEIKYSILVFPEQRNGEQFFIVCFSRTGQQTSASIHERAAFIKWYQDTTRLGFSEEDSALADIMNKAICHRFEELNDAEE